MTEMEYRNLGSSGLRVSVVGLGGNNFGRPGSATESLAGTEAVVREAIDVGVTLIDTADMYGGGEPGLSERLLGQTLQGVRDHVVLASKFGHSGFEMGIPSWGAKGSARYIRLALEASLRRLRTDWIDLYQLHTPDPNTPIAETLVCLDQLVREGKIRYIGHSNLSAWQLAEAHFVARELGTTAFISAQNEYSLLARDAEKDLLPAADHFGVGVLPYFPLYNGLLTGKFTRAGGPNDSRIMRQRPHLQQNAPWDALERYEAWCAEREVSMLEATFAWLLAQPALASVIAGATTPGQIRQNAEAGVRWKPTAQEVAAIGAFFD